MRFNRIFLFVFCVFLLFPLAACGKAEATPQQTIGMSSAAQEGSFLDALTFLGDSTTAHMQQRSPLRQEQIWATKNRYLNLDARITTARIVAPDTGEEDPIAAVAARLRPAFLVITLGVDYGVYYYRNKPEVFRHYYEKLLDAVHEASPDTVLILQSVFPVASSSAVITNEMIDNANGIIRSIATRRGLVFVDQKPVLADAQGFLRAEYCSSEDGIHLTRDAYAVIFENLKKYEREITGVK